ncbi:MAG: pentapeptide repeat-containing protein [Actinomycetota bacterium]|nr:pentapeptide repeat-containing protein [Actinomycetota bacterium]
MDIKVLAGIGAVLAMVAIVVLPRWVAPRHLFESHAARLGVENEIRRTIIQMLGGSFVLATVFFTYETVRISQESLRLTERGQITERFTRAIDQIGGDKLDVAIGGIYALGQIAQESKTEHVPIMNILETYIHEHSPALTRDNCETEELPIDVQAALTVIGNRNLAFEDDETVIDLEGVHLATGDFSGGNYEHVEFSNSCLYGADFRDAQLNGVNFESKRHTPSDLSRSGTNLNLATFEGAQAAGADFSAVEASPISMDGADLKGADFYFADLGDNAPGINSRSDLSGADLRGADLRNADLTFVIFKGSDLRDADLRDADLPFVIFKRTDLRGADLRGADMKRAFVDREELEDALTNASTRFPWTARDER